MKREPPLRWLIVLSWACTFAMMAVAFLQPEAVSADIQAAVDEAFFSGPIQMGEWSPIALGAVLVCLCALLLAHLVGVIGLFFFRRWGRALSLWTTMAGLLINVALGPQLYSGLESFFWATSNLLWGAALALAYWSRAAQRFAAARDGTSDVDITVLAPP